MNTQYLVRQEVQLLNEKLNLLWIFFIKAKVFVITSQKPKNLKEHSSKSNFIPHRPYASVHVKNESNKWSLSNPTHKSKTGISNDMQCSNKLNTPMTCNPQSRYKLCPINNIATNKNKNIFYIQKKQIYTDKNKQNNK